MTHEMSSQANRMKIASALLFLGFSCILGYTAEINRKTFSMSLPNGWTEKTKDDMYEPDSFVFFEGPQSCFFNVVVGKKSAGVTIDILADYERNAMLKKFMEPTTTTIAKWSTFEGKGYEIEGKIGGIVHSRVRIFGFEKSDNVYLLIEYGDLTDLTTFAADFDKIRQTFKPNTASAFGDNPTEHYNRAIEKAQQGNFNAAVADFSEAIKLKPDYAEAYNKRGMAKGGLAKSLDDLASAMADYNKAIELQPDYAEAYYNRGIAEQAKGDKTSALADQNKAIELKPDYVQAYYNRGMVKASNHDFKGAMADYNKAIELKPDATLAYNHRGLLKQVEGDLDGAMADYNTAIELKPDYFLAYENRSKLKKAEGDIVDAQADHDKAVELKTREARAR